MRVPAFWLAFLFVLSFGRLDLAANAEPAPLLHLSDAERQILAEAFRLADKDRWPEALSYAQRVSDPVAAKLITWRRLNNGVSTAGFREYAEFLERHPDWPQSSTLSAHAERAMDDALSAEEVIIWFTRHPPRTEEGRLRLIDALLASGHTAKAGEWVRHTWRNDRLGGNLWRSFYNKHRRFLGLDDNWVRTDTLLWNGSASAARDMLQLLPRGERELAAARLALQTRRPGVDAYIARVPRSLQRDPGLIYERLRWRRRNGLDEGAIQLLRAVPGDLGPKPEKWWDERRRQARNLFEAGEIAAAYRLIAEHGQAPGSPQYAEAEWFAGWLALRFLNAKAAAAEHFLKLFEGVKYPISRARGAYWRARASEALGHADHAARWYGIAARYPTTYYGQLALETVRSERALHLSPVRAAPRDHWVSFRQREVVRAALVLAELQQWPTLKTFVLHLAEGAKTPIEHAMLGELVTHYRQYDLAVRIGKISARGEEPVVDYGYPLFRLPEVATEPALVFAIMRQESEFSVTAVSPAGAHGLMQLMPGTAHDMARVSGLDYNRGRLLTDPNYNVVLGSAYIIKMLEEFNGSYLLAVAAYNAGPGRVREWIKRFGDPRRSEVDAVDWVESIPFEETRNYVQRVLESLQVYRHRLAERPTASQLTMDLSGSGRGGSGPARTMQ